LRWIAREIGFEKLILKFGKLTGYFITNEQSPYYQTQTFSKVLKYLQHHHQHTKMEEKNNRLQLSVTDVRSVRAAIAIVQGIRNTSLS
jgi:transcription-repair coupling factor (superfamily II helicase)